MDECKSLKDRLRDDPEFKKKIEAILSEPLFPGALPMRLECQHSDGTKHLIIEGTKNAE